MEASGTVLRGNFSGAAQRAGARSRTTPRRNGASGGCWRGFTGLRSGLCANKSSPLPRRSSCDGCCAGSMWRRGRRLRASEARSKCCSNCKDSKFPPMHGSGRCWRAALPTTIRKWLDQLCLTGAVGWGRLSPHPATLDSTPSRKNLETRPGQLLRQRRVIPTSVAPITFFVREEADWMTPRHPGSEPG